ncbi:vacuolar segregation protein PEP7 [Histoplasma capsulatum G186AR]|uniref:Vacuolar segregation protein PEP7 n=1 Tax=Ajellomyces capsulatus (strain G186AR / H82 / ATCC MYA-2454 / RMSCC 2432) TaxID=447093 RepID=C0NPZ0_AJECG|nr:vacuolar segregation protein PEP7 [Histoplasma capsulatum G186AR]EEH07000.1 vacuolar segregation protein PEP7 [Histoplasma capsulatum G186AR]
MPLIPKADPPVSKMECLPIPAAKQKVARPFPSIRNAAHTSSEYRQNPLYCYYAVQCPQAFLFLGNMRKRTLGGGRVLGSGRSLNPAAPTSSLQKDSRIHSPSPSSVSLNSQGAVSQMSVDTQDIVSRISLENGDSSISRVAAAAGSSRLACPICNEEMLTLLQLNRHLDDTHANLEGDRQVEVKDWFQIQVEKAKRFQPLAVLNQKLKGLDVFESNHNAAVSVSGPTRISSGQTGPELPRILDPDEVVTREHWQGRGMYDVCLEPMCQKRLTVSSGSVNCRKCGKLFCEEHTMYQMKLSRSAQHEPVRGFWCRVCETCYKSREGYNNRNGQERDHTAEFAELRRQKVDKAFLEVSRLEKRLTRLTQLLSTLPADQIQSGANKRWSITWQNDHRKTLEQSVKPTTTGTKLNIDIRLCKECKSTIFSRRDVAQDLLKEPPDLRAYKNLVQFEKGIRLLLPRFQKLLSALQDPEKAPSPTQLTEASKVRKRLMDSFAQYDIAARRIRDLPTQSPTQAKLQKAIYHQATNFLHLHMLPLKSLPKVLKHATPHGSRLPPNANTGVANGGTSALAAIKYGNGESANSTASLASDNSSAISALETEEKSLRERLIVLEEQKFFVTEMIADANRRRKYDEASSLVQNAEELSKEIDRINGMIGQLDFEGLYSDQTA